MHRKTVSIVLFTVMLLAIIAFPAFVTKGSSAFAAGNNVAFIIGLNKYFLNDQLPGVDMDVAPFIQDGRTFVPVRYLANALGVTDDNIKWDSVARQVYLKLNSTTVTLVIGQAQITTNGQTKAIDVAPLIKSDRTFLPARYVAEALGFTVDWDDANKVVVCWPQELSKPALSNVIAQAVQFNGKPEAVKKIEAALGLTMESADRPGYSNPGRWTYNAPAPAIPPEPARSQIIANKDKSYVYADYDNGSIWINIRWASVVPDINTVTYDLTPIEKTLKAFFPGQEAQFPAIMAKAKEIADVTKQSNRFKRANVAEFNLNGRTVTLSSGDLNFVSLDFKST